MPVPKRVVELVSYTGAVLSLQAFWNWVENYPDEFTMLYQRPQADMAGMNGFKALKLNCLNLYMSSCVRCSTNKIYHKHVFHNS